MISFLHSKINKKWSLLLKVIPIVLILILLKLVFHSLKLEFIALGPLFTVLITANTFTIGFLLSGTMNDFKEGEKVPGEIATVLETISEDMKSFYKSKKLPAALECLHSLQKFNKNLIDWFHLHQRSRVIMDGMLEINEKIAVLEPAIQPNYLIRLKQELNSMRKMITRVHTIRDTSFIQSGHAIAEIITGLLCCGFLFARIEPFYESLFYMSSILFLMIYILLLIKDLDNPFDYNDLTHSASLVSIKPIVDQEKRLADMVAELEKIKA